MTAAAIISRQILRRPLPPRRSSTSTEEGAAGGGQPGVDTAPPTISNVAVTQTGSAAVNITFTTSKIANGTVQYGLDTSYGSTAGDTSVYQISHSVVLSGLTPLSTYHFAINSADTNGNTTSATDATFTLVNYSDPAANTNLYNSTTPNATSTPVGTVLSADDQDLLSKIKSVSVSMAQQILSALANNPNLASIPQDAFADAINGLTSKIISPPTISGPAISVIPGSHSAEIKWTTNKKSNSLVAFADAADYSAEAADPYQTTTGDPDDSVTDHDITIPNLLANTTYHFQVRSQGVVGGAGFSTDHTFKTGSALPQVFNMTFQDIGENGATSDGIRTCPQRRK